MYSIQIGFRRKYSDLYESVSFLKYHFTHFIEIWRKKPISACFGTQMYYETSEPFELYVI